MGVIAAICPSTNPAATPANKTMMALKGRNAVILSPSPKGVSTCRLLVSYIYEQLDKVGAPRDLVQFIDQPSKALTYELMAQADFVVVTGSQKNVHAAYSSGTPAIGVGVGNAPVIIDESADLADAAEKIARSKTFDNATSCSSENSIHVHDKVYESALEVLKANGGYLLTIEEKRRLQEVMWPGGKLSTAIMAQDAAKIAAAAGLDSPEAASARFFMVEEDGYGADFPFSGGEAVVGPDRLSLVRPRCRARADPGDPRLPRCRTLVRNPHGGRGACPTGCRTAPGGPRARQPGPCPGQRWRLRQRPRIHPDDGWRHLGGQQHQREPLLPALPQHHPPGTSDPAAQPTEAELLRDPTSPTTDGEGT